jgi:hypothetical protein
LLDGKDYAVQDGDVMQHLAGIARRNRRRSWLQSVHPLTGDMPVLGAARRKVPFSTMGFDFRLASGLQRLSSPGSLSNQADCVNGDI